MAFIWPQEMMRKAEDLVVRARTAWLHNWADDPEEIQEIAMLLAEAHAKMVAFRLTNFPDET